MYLIKNNHCCPVTRYKASCICNCTYQYTHRGADWFISTACHSDVSACRMCCRIFKVFYRQYTYIVGNYIIYLYEL